jgi:hypothetical protein
LALIVTGPATAADTSGQVREIIGSSPVFSAPMTFTDVGVARKRAVQVDVAQLQSLAAAGAAQRFIVHLFDDARFEAQIVSTDSTADGGTIHVARLVGVPDGQAIFVVNGRIVSGSITLPGAFYQVRTIAGGAQIVQQLDHSQFPPDEPFLPTPRFELAPEVAPQAMGDTGATIDVMVAYTATTRANAGGTAQILNQINLAIAETNQAYANSAIVPRLRLVHAVEVAYTETGNSGTDLDRLTYTNDGYIDQLHTLRNTYGADLVSLMVENGGGYCGIGWLMTNVSTSFAPYGFSVVARGCATGYYSFAHELGHNMGARHDTYVDSATTPYPYAHGYASVAGRWRTILAYNDACAAAGTNCTRIQYFSNPGITYGGAPMGNASADNHQALNNTAFAVANFRQATVFAPEAKSDFNGDGKSDILWDNGAGSRWAYTMNGAVVQGSTAMPGVAPGWAFAGIGDFNGDGKADLLWKNNASPTQFWVYIMNGATVIGSGGFAVAAGYGLRFVADFDGDGKADIVWENASGQRWIYFMNGVSVAGGAGLPAAAPGWNLVGAADLSGDGKADLIWRNGAAPTQYWVYLMNGATATGGGGFSTAAGYELTRIGDFDGNGKSDLLWETPAGARWIYFMNGATVASGGAPPGAAPGWSIVGVADFDGNGKSDLLWRNASTTQYWIYLLNGVALAGGGGLTASPGYQPMLPWY